MSPRERDEPVRLTKIYTRGGDAGETSLGDGSRVPKTHPLVAVERTDGATTMEKLPDVRYEWKPVPADPESSGR